MKISFCTVSMNRLHHLKQTLIKNIEENCSNSLEFKFEYVLLDYNSNDGLESWVKKNLFNYIEAGVLIFYRTAFPMYFDRSHSRNMAFRLATGDIICNIDADNFAGPGFAKYLYEIFLNNNLFLTPPYRHRDIMGKVCVKKKDFLSVRGYDERMNGYGFEDLDLYNRLEKYGVRHLVILENSFTSAIKHSHLERFKNEFIGKNISEVYINYIDCYCSEIILLYKNFKFEKGVINNNKLKISSKKYDYNNRLAENIFETNDFFVHEELNNTITIAEDWKFGTWSIKENNSTLLYLKDMSSQLLMYHTSMSKLDCDTNKIYHKASGNEILSAILILKTELSNRKRMNDKNNHETFITNKYGFGNGKVSKNFSDYIVEIKSL